MRKLLWFTIGIAAAAAVGMYGMQGQWYFLASGIAALLFGAFLLLMQRFEKLRIVTALLLGCTFGFLWMSLVDGLYLSIPRAADEKRVILTVTATDYSRQTEYGTVVEGVGKLNDRYYLLSLSLPEDAEVAPGDRLTGRFLLRATLPGCTGELQHYYSRGIFVTGKMSRMPQIDKAQKLPWYGYPALARQSIKTLICDIFPQDTAAFATALLIGDTEGIDYETDTAFKISGIRHIVAISGFHVTVLFAIVQLILFKNRWLSAIIGFPVLFLFAAIVGFSPSITRACLMHSLMILASLLEKDYDPLTALAFAVLTMLVLNFWTIANVSFQLSVCCMLGISLFSERIKLWILERRCFASLKRKRKKAAAGFAASIGMSLGATVFVTPLCAYYFGMVSLVSVLANLLTLWVITMIFYGIMLACLLGLLWGPIGIGAAWLTSWLIRYVLEAAGILAKFPLAAVYTDSVYVVFWLVFVYILLAVVLLSRKKQILLTACCAVISLCMALMASWTQPMLDECRVTVLDVGQGQSILLQGAGKTYLVDCGGDVDTKAADAAANQLLSQGIHRLDGVILTHFDRDHAAGVAYLLSRIPADVLILPNCEDVDGILPQINGVHRGQCITIYELSQMQFSDTAITFIPSLSEESDNEGGLCVLFQTENCDILITGDRSAAGERALLRQIDLPQLEVLIVGHHGSGNSTSQMLLQQTCPEIAIISVGADNIYGHPAQQTLQRLEEAGCVIYRTDLHGTVIYRG